ncbi:MAG: hypothetical protein WA110_07355 [Anaerolineaceae bacterium]
MDNLVNAIKDKLKEPKNLAITVGILGLLIGLLFGWVIFPVQWTDTNAETMRPDLRQDYLRMVITNYNLTYDQAKARQLYEELGKNAETTLGEVQNTPLYLNQEQISRFSAAINAEIPAEVISEETPSETTASAEPEKSNGLLTLGLTLLGILIVGAVLVYFFFYRNRMKTNTAPLENVSRPAAVPQAVPFATRPAAVPQAAPAASKQNGRTAPVSDKPIAQFMTTYMFGDDLYDESFTFDAPNGEFLGECGVSISDIIGVGEPKKISAFEVWLFDKNDIQTVTKVLMSGHVFSEPNLRQRLELRGEPILSEPGKQFELETATLRLEARIVDLAYGDIPLPEQSYFQRSTIELAVYRK